MTASMWRQPGLPNRFASLLNSTGSSRARVGVFHQATLILQLAGGATKQLIFGGTTQIHTRLGLTVRVRIAIGSSAMRPGTRRHIYNARANSSQKLSRPGAGPPAEPASQHTRIAASRRLQFASRCMQLLGGNRRTASASAHGPWPCSLGSSR
jgi:hypothetical protein